MNLTIELQAYNKRYLSSIKIAEFGEKIYNCAEKILLEE